MKLHITRKSSKGMLGGISFEYLIKIEPTPQEQALLREYKVDHQVVHEGTRKILGQEFEFRVTVNDLIQGKTFKSRNIDELIAIENNAIQSCEALKIVLHAMSKIGEEEVINF